MMLFADRIDAGRRLANRLQHLRDNDDVVVVGLPRGGVPVAAQVAQALHAPLDVLMVRKLGVPFQPELAMGAIGEGGVRFVNQAVVKATQLSEQELEHAAARERVELESRAERFRRGHVRLPLAGRTVVVVDDGIATGSTAQVACQVVRAQGAQRVVLAVPVAPKGWEAGLATVADELVSLANPESFGGVGQWYQDFTQTTDDEVLAFLDTAPAPATTQARRVSGGATGPTGAPEDPAKPPNAQGDGVDQADGAERAANDPLGRDVQPALDDPLGRVVPPHPADPLGRDGSLERDGEVEVQAGSVHLAGHLTVPKACPGEDRPPIVVFVHGSGSSRHSPRNRQVAEKLNQIGLGTLLFDLLTAGEEQDRAKVFDIELLAQRLSDVTRWLRGQPEGRDVPVGYFGASTGAAAALWAASEPDNDVLAVVSRGGRPDLTGPRLGQVTAPTLLIVGGNDPLVLDLNEEARSRLHGKCRLEVVPGASHLFEEPGALDTVTRLGAAWFVDHLAHLTRT